MLMIIPFPSNLFLGAKDSFEPEFQKRILFQFIEQLFQTIALTLWVRKR